MTITPTPAPTAAAATGPVAAGKPTSSALPAAPLHALPTPPAASDTPRRLRRYQLITAVAVLILGLCGVAQLGQLRTNLGTAPLQGTQHVRIGEVSAAISAAGNEAELQALDASAGGSEESSKTLATAAELLVEVAAAEPAQATAIAAINTDLLSYGQLLSAAKFADAEQLRDSSLQPGLDQLSQNLIDADSRSSWWTAPWISLGLGLVVVVGLCWLSFQVAQRSHRVLNSGLVAAVVATVAITGLAVGGSPVSAGVSTSTRSVIETSTQFTQAQLQSDAATRALLSAARNKRWDAAAKSAFNTADQAAAAAFTGAPSSQYDQLRAARKPVTTALAAGNWTKASKLLTSDENLTNSQSQLADALAEQRTSLSGVAAADSTTDSLLFLFELGVAILGLAGAFLGIRGLQTRIEEYR